MSVEAAGGDSGEQAESPVIRLVRWADVRGALQRQFRQACAEQVDDLDAPFLPRPEELDRWDTMATAARATTQDDPCLMLAIAEGPAQWLLGGFGLELLPAQAIGRNPRAIAR